MALNNTNVKSNVSFSSVVQTEKVPSREQAIILDSIEGYTVEEYALALCKLIKRKDITHISRINSNRICFYLTSKNLVDELIEKKSKISLGDHTLSIRRLVAKASRIIISNVQPCIPTAVILQELYKLEIIPVSQITTIKAGTQHSELSHILSFRKQLYIKPEDMDKIPSNLKINYDNVNYWIYFSSEKMSCFLCHQEGHIAKNCQSASNSQNETVESNANTQSPEPIENIVNEQKEDSPQPMDASSATPPSKIFKRPPPPSSSDASSALEGNEKNNNHKTPKKLKKSQKELKTIDFEIALEPAKEYVVINSNDFPINFADLVSFLSNIRSSSVNILELAQLYTKDIAALSKMLSLIYPYLNGKHVKSRITRIKNTLDSKAENVLMSDSSLSDSA